MKKALVLLLLLAPLATATPLEADSNTIKVDVSNILEIEPHGANYRVDKVEAELSWVPAETYRQEVLNINTEPSSENIGEDITFEWTSPREKELWLKITGTVKTNANYYPVTTHVDFPIRKVESSMSRYLGEKEIIDINEEIEAKAAQMVEGKDDLYDVVFTIARWVNKNIDYELDTVTADASQKSSWVFENRRGVCDEMTSLFISMLRSLGIPARFAYGEAYTNAYINSEWGGHGWAEVWFPGYGWVPFDPTYGQYGYLDPGHVKMGHSEDARKPSLKYSMTSRNAGIKSGFLDVKAQVISEKAPMRPGIVLDAEAYFAETGFDSYNLITATIVNMNNVYKPVIIQAVAPEEVLVEEQKQYILLKPGETRKVNWLVKTKDLREEYVYTLPIRIITDRKAEENVTYKSQQRSKSYKRDFFEEVLTAKPDDKPYNRYITLRCDPTKEEVYVGDETGVGCTVTNEGSKILEGLEICHSNCEEIGLEAGQSKALVFKASYEDPGVKNAIVTARNQDVSKTSYSKINVIDGADVEISMSAPRTAYFNDRISIKFNITKESKSTPENVRAKLSSIGGSQEWEIGSLEGPQKFDVRVNTNNFGFTNEFTLDVWYEDKLGREYHEQDKATIEIAPLTFWEQLKALLNAVGWEIYKLFT